MTEKSASIFLPTLYEEYLNGNYSFSIDLVEVRLVSKE